ncbi:MAG: hypothetical protein OXE92_05640 [Bacteroidetes bacterium]|nr:hypothetical protein [Bacteroidota bacterium]
MITTHEDLLDLCSQIESLTSVALDTEFDSGRHPVTVLSVVQVGLDNKETILIDALALKDLSALKPVLEHEGIVKIMHDARQDLWLISNASSATPKNIFDVRLAARLLGMGTYYSLPELVQTFLGIRLSKSQQRSNWLHRPLSAAQISYAKKDVLYLHRIREILLSEAKKTERSTWIKEEMNSFNDPKSYTPLSSAEKILNSQATYLFEPAQRAAITMIADWREHTSQATGLLPKNLLTDGQIIRLAKNRCTKPKAVRKNCSALPQRYGLEVANLMAEALNTPEHECPAPLAPRPVSGTEFSQVQLLHAIITSRAIEIGIQSELLGTNSSLTDLVQNPGNSNHPLRKGWRWDVVGQDLFDVMRGNSVVELQDGRLKVRSLLR